MLQKKRRAYERLNNIPEATDQASCVAGVWASSELSHLLLFADVESPSVGLWQWWDSYKILDLKYSIMPQSTQPSSLLLSAPRHPGLRSEQGVSFYEKAPEIWFHCQVFILEQFSFPMKIHVNGRN